MTNLYKAPSSDLSSQSDELEYVGFWARAGASIIDTICILLVTYPILIAIYGMTYLSKSSLAAGPADVFLTYIVPAAIVIGFWIYTSSTPGKMLVGAKIVDAKTGNKPSTGQLIGRYFGYYLSLIPFGLGYLWVGWDSRKQGWHDMLAGTVVVRSSRNRKTPVTFPNG